MKERSWRRVKNISGCCACGVDIHSKFGRARRGSTGSKGDAAEGDRRLIALGSMLLAGVSGESAGDAGRRVCASLAGSAAGVDEACWAFAAVVGRLDRWDTETFAPLSSSSEDFE